jgi:uracil phosphoribosyltransferase
MYIQEDETMLHVLNHPLITHKLTTMRKIETGTKDFRQYLDEIASLMAYEITKDLPLRPVNIETPMGKTVGYEMAQDVVLVPILRAGLGMVDGIQNMIPTAKVGHIGLYRDEDTLEPHQYYAKFPKNISQSIVLILDPMLATGGSAKAAIDMVKKTGATNIKLINLVGVQEGIDVIEKAHPDVDIYLAAKDEKLNEIGYIVPGLGDAGDRIFGTK